MPAIYATIQYAHEGSQSIFDVNDWNCEYTTIATHSTYTRL